MSLTRKISVLLEMIKFKLTIFAMPFALTGAFLAAGGVPDLRAFFWIILAMIGARTSAMGFNRIIDWRFDAANPRTEKRAIPAGEVNLKEAWLMVVAAALLFFFSCYQLNRLTLLLSPLALGLTFFYSFTKRFTSLCHLVLGVALAFAPLGGWVAVRGSLTEFPFVLSLGVLFWVAGFDTIYGCLDVDYDRRAGLYSLPARLGPSNAFRVAVVFHLLAFLLFTVTGVQMGLNYFYFLGLLLTAAARPYQPLMVTPAGLPRLHASFFSMNGLISITIFCATWLSLATS